MTLSRTREKGFTLIEVMLVIVIMSIMVSLVVLNVSGIDQRKAMQARDVFRLDVQKIRNASADQGRILGLRIEPATDVQSARYVVMEYKITTTQDHSRIATWQAAQDFQSKTLPDDSDIKIEYLQATEPLNPLQQQTQQPLPQMIWLGNGEAIPVRIQFYFQRQPLGDALQLNQQGLILDERS